MIVNEILRDTDGKRWNRKRERKRERKKEKVYAFKLFYYFSFASSCKRDIHFLQSKLRARPTVIKNTIEIYLAEEPVLLRANKSHAVIQALQRLKIQCCTI